ncbi:MAG TPA: CAP domain-containing protein [Gemmatimonadota bacterium]
MRAAARIGFGGLSGTLAAVAALACAAAYAPRPAPDSGATTVPIRDRYARARVEMVAAVNADRMRSGRPPVVLDSLASVVAQAHAEEMAAGGWLSHYSAAGLAPYERFAAAGGTGHVMENVFRSQARTAAEWALDDPWPRFDIGEAQGWLMSSSGHRATILDPHRARIGVGIAVDRARSAVYVVQELVTAAATLSPPGMVLPGQEASVSGRVQVDGARPLMLVLSREPIERPWVASGRRPPGGAYSDGGPESLVIPPWAIRWNPDDRSFGLALRMSRGAGPARWYGVLYVAPEGAVREAVAQRRAATDAGWPAAAFVVEVL